LASENPRSLGITVKVIEDNPLPIRGKKGATIPDADAREQ
jgi:hypothetical protein